MQNETIEDFLQPQQSQKHGIQYEKDGPYSLAMGRKEAILAEWAANLANLRCRLPVFTGERINAHVYQPLLRQHVVPWGQRTYCDTKYIFRRIQRWPTPLNPPNGC